MNFTDLIDDSGLLFSGAATLLAIALAAVLIVSARRGRKMFTPVTIFFVFITVHALAGYRLAFLTADQIGRAGVALEAYFNKSLLILAMGVASISLGYIFCPPGFGRRMQERCIRGAQGVSSEMLVNRSWFFIMLAAVLTAIGLAMYGSIPLFQDFAHRYSNVFKPSYGWGAFMVNRGRDLVQLPVAFSILMLLRRRYVLKNLTFIILGLTICILTVTRTPIVDILLTVLIVISLRGRTSTLMLGGGLVLFGYLATQLLLVKNPVDSLDQFLATAGGALPELRDFGNVLQKEPDRFWGLTFLIGSLPVPGFFSEFTSAYLIRTITLNAIGIPLDAPHGGLRITYLGECYLNFGYAGVVIGGFLMGMLYAWFGRLFEAIYALEDVRTDYLVASLWMMFSFELYLSGSGVAGMIKVILLVLVMLFIPLRKSAAARVRHQASARLLRDETVSYEPV